MNILLVEDDESIAKGLEYFFEQNQHILICQATCENAIQYLQHENPSFIILDVTLPDGSGFDLYENFIKSKKIPTLFLTARDEEEDVVKGLELGVDDYMTKPFFNKELLARINRIIKKNKQNQLVKIQDIIFDLDKMVVFHNDDEIVLTSLERKLLFLLINHINKVVSRNYIIDCIWEWTGNDVNDNTVTVYMKRIRNKLGTDIIKTVKGVGYRIDEE